MIGDEALETVLSAESYDERTHENDAGENDSAEIVDLGDEPQIEIITAGEIVDIDDFVFVITGEIVQSNFQEVARQIKQNISQIGEELETEEDFELASKVAEKLREAKKALEAKREAAFQKADALYSELKAIEGVEDECAAKALALEKLVTAEKLRKKTNLVNEHFKSCQEHYAEAREKWVDFALCKPEITDFNLEAFTAVVKNCRSFTSMAERLVKKANEVKGDINEQIDSISDNARTLDAAGNKALFSDRKALLMMSDELLRATIQGRIATHEAEELKKQQEADRLEREAEEQRLADEAPWEGENQFSDKAEAAVETLANEPAQAAAPKIDNRPPFGFSGGSPVPVVRKPETTPQAENLTPTSHEQAKPEQVADLDLVRSFRLEADMTCTVGRAKEIAGIIHGRVKNLNEVHRVGLVDSAKPSKLITAIVNELNRQQQHDAVQTVLKIVQGEK